MKVWTTIRITLATVLIPSPFPETGKGEESYQLEALTERLDREQMSALMAERNRVKSLRYLYETVL